MLEFEKSKTHINKKNKLKKIMNPRTNNQFTLSPVLRK